MQRDDYDMKLLSMADDAIRQVFYSPTVDTTLCNLKNFNILRQNFKDKYNRYRYMRLVIKSAW